MSRPVEYESGAPNVYQPQPAPAPAYEEYTDPAAAHGWQNVYDATAELPRIEPAAPAPGDREPPGPHSTGRAARRRAAQGKGPWRSRRVVVAVGAFGVVSAAALIAGLSFSGPAQDRRVGIPSASTGTSDATDPASSARPAVPGATASDEPATRAAVSGPAASADASAGPEPGGSPSAGASSGTRPTPSGSPSPSPSSSASADGPGNSGGKGHGQGSTKGPK
jgi:hypothetical protein